MALHWNLIVIFASALVFGASRTFSASQQNKEELRQLQTDFYKINEYLESRVGKEATDVEHILREASDWLNSLDKSASQDTQGSLMSSLELFVSLSELTRPESTCNSRGRQIIDANNKALANLARYGLRPVDKVALKYMQQHARKCCSQYPGAYRRALSSIGKHDFRKVEAFGESIGEFALERGNFQLTFGAQRLEEVVGRHPLVYILLLDDTSKSSSATTRRRPDEIKALARFLKEQSGAEELPKDHEALDKLFRDQLLDPCRRFTEQVGPEVFQPLEADLIIGLDSRGRVAECDTNSIEFKLGMAYHKLCNMYILSDRANRLVDSIAKVSVEQ